MGIEGFFSSIPLCLILTAIPSYFLGSLNGAILASELFYREDVRHHGSGNAGLTNFYRVYGGRYAWCVIAVDMLKAGLSILIGAFLFKGAVFGKYLGAFFCVLGHMFPMLYRWKGGKGILCSGMALLCLDWRIALAGWGLFLFFWATTKYVSLGSVSAAISFPISTAFIYRGEASFPLLLLLSSLVAILILWAHRGNIKRLLNGTESKFKWHSGDPRTKKKKQD